METDPPTFFATRDDALRARARHDGALRRSILDVHAAASADWRRAPDVIARGLRELHGLGSSERRFASEAVHALVRHRRRLAFLAGEPEDPEPTARASAALLDAHMYPPVDADARLAAIDDPVRRVGVSLSYPDWIVARLVASASLEAAAALLDAMNHRAPLTVRVNRIKGSREELARLLDRLGIGSSPTSFAADGLVLDTRRNVYELPPFRDGWMELQDEGSQLVAELVAPPPRSTVIDACAGAGGKTLALGAMLENRGRVVAFDISEPKLVELKKRARRAGLSNWRADRVASGPPEGTPMAARVLVDAPCSGLGVVRRNPETKWRLRPADLDELTGKQRAILDAYAPLVEPGGRLIYATCSVFAEENDAIVAAFLAARDDFEPVPVKEIWGTERALRVGDGQVLRVLPNVHDTDGFFAAVLRRKR